MLFFGHIGITTFIGRFLFLSFWIVAFSAFLPDIVDKGLFVSGMSQYTRLVAHNLFFGPIVSVLALALTKRKEVAIAVLFGTYMHLIEDMRHPLPLLWPFVSYDAPPLKELKIAPDLFDIALEGIGISSLAVLFLFRKNINHSRNKLWTKLRGYYDRRIEKKV